MDGNEQPGFAPHSRTSAASAVGTKRSSSASALDSDQLAALASSATAGAGFAGSDGGGAPEPAGPPASDAAYDERQPRGAEDQQSQQQQSQQQQQQQQPAEGPAPLSLQELRSLSSLSRRAEQVWGCLRPAPDCKGQLPFVLLQGRGVAVGRGRDTYNERLSQLALSRASSLAATGSSSLHRSSSAAAAAAVAAADGSAPPPSPTHRRRSSEAGARGCTFIEVADGRVSRLHAIVRWDTLQQQALLEDLSSNGTYVNGERVGQGCSAPLADGDRISLVLSVAPLAEQAWVFHAGDPRGLEGDVPAIWADDSLQARRPVSPLTPTSEGDELPSSRSDGAMLAGGASGRLARCQTSSYSTKDAITLEDLQCQICLCTLRDCVALEPCGHNYCAACLSHHFAALLRGGQPLACPMRCAAPQRVVANTAVRQLLARPGALEALAPSLRRSSVQPALSSQQQHAGSMLETLPEATASSCSSAGGSGTSDLPPGSRLPSMESTPADSLRAQAAAAALLEGSLAAGSEAAAGAAADAAADAAPDAADAEAWGQYAASEGSRPASRASVAASSEAESPASNASDYRHVVLRPGSAGSHPLATPPPSPFLSFTSARRFGSLRSGDLDDPGRQAPVALPGAPTMQAASPLGAAASQPDMAGPTSLPGQATMLAIAPLGTAASEASVQGPLALPGEPTLPADSPFVLPSGSLLRQQSSRAEQQAQQAEQQHLEALTEEPLDSLEEPAAESGAPGAVESSVGSAPPPGSWAALAAQLNASVGHAPAASGGAAEQPAAGGAAAAPAAAAMQSLPSASSAAVASQQSAEGEEAPLPMHPLCPLDDAVLPLNTSDLKTRQLRQALIDVLGSQTPDEATTGLEALARLTWSDESARLDLVQEGGVEWVATVMRKFLDNDSVQCTGCLALLALLRGEGPASDAARQRMEDGEVIRTIAEGMEAHQFAPMVQLSALLCLVPLALNHTNMQVTVAKICLPHILDAVRHNVGELEVVSKGLILLGVLCQGDEEYHEHLRSILVQRTMFAQLVGAVLAVLAPASEDVLWSALFVLAVVARDTSDKFVPHMLMLVRAGVLPALEHALAAYRQTMDDQDQEPDEMIVRAGDYLVVVLTKARRLLWLRRSRRVWQAGLLGVAALAAFRYA
ncbi:E3 ubiquitin- ligase CHFR isoform X4 [Chlorella sorokiniana]|uniref:E3 ubiquitin-protein ligase CHFR n=1 Tax=Chlorella sorokiniana TaxID=3076 RepID=A0A2P6U1L7_CHLSO|nr:E3 ubiquitin- ligase CHFR isoform X4 [Chlorella sorokiniana]|eukprot:PRW60207.1 E3 ubiquitin- ligase CHFR isoform X4 [Chlorella sorokiniana]